MGVGSAMYFECHTSIACPQSSSMDSRRQAKKGLLQGNLEENRKKGNERHRVGINQPERLATERNQWHSPDDASCAKTHKEN